MLARVRHGARTGRRLNSLHPRRSGRGPSLGAARSAASLIAIAITAGPGAASEAAGEAAVLPTVAFAATSSAAGEGAGQVLVEVRLSAAATGPVSVPFTLGGTATPGADFVPPPSPVVIPAGATSAQVPIGLVQDALYEGAQETVQLTLGVPTGATLGLPSAHLLSIQDDDPMPRVAFAAARSVVSEAAGGFSLRLVLSAVSGRDAVVPLTLSGPASGPSDLSLATNPVTVPAGQSFVDVPVSLVVDHIGEAGETVRFELGAPIAHAAPGTPSAHVVLIDDGNAGFGVPLPPALLPSPSTVVFPQTSVGVSAGVRVVQVSNPYSAPISFLGLELRSGLGAEITVRFPGQAPPVSLAPGQSVPVELELQPVLPGPRSVELEVLQGLGGIPPAVVRAEGVALGPPGHEVVMRSAETEYVSPERVYWSPDFGVLVSEGYFTSQLEVLGTEDDVLYQHSRWGRRIEYRLPLPNGHYELGFRSWEPVHTAPGLRVFDVTAEGQLLYDDVDVVAAAGPRQAWISPKRRIQVTDGALDLRFDASVARALVSALEVRSIPVLATPTPVLDFGTVDQGSFGQLDIEIGNTGLAPAHATSVQIFPGGSGSAAEFALEVGGSLLPGGPNATNYALDLPLPPGQTLRLPLIFTPTQHHDHDLSLRINFAHGESVEVDVRGTGGASPGWGFLHPTIEIEPAVVIDYDSSGDEQVELNGETSHTHEPGHTLTSFTWHVNGQLVGSGPKTSATLSLGQSFVELTIADSNVPPATAMERLPVAVHPVTAVPGILARYYDGSVVGEVFLLDNLPAAPDFVARQSQLRTAASGATVGTSPFGRDVMVRWTANFTLSAATTVTFSAYGGTARRVRVDGQVVQGPISLAPGPHALDVRFAVASTVELPLELVVSANGGPIPGFVQRLTHGEDTLVPVIHSMPTNGLELGGNDIVIEGFAFAPRDQVVVNWGPTVITPAQFLLHSAERIHFLSPPGTGAVPVSVTTPNGTSNALTFYYSSSGPVPIRWSVLHDRSVDVTAPTRVTFGPDGRLWVALLDGSLRAIRFDDQWHPTSVQYYAGISHLPNKDVLGIAFDPYDVYDPQGPGSLSIYVAHGEHYLNGGTTPTGPSPFTGAVSRLTGPGFDAPVAILSGLPTSNHDHSINGIEFDDNGDLLVSVGGNTNAGVEAVPMGDLPESPHSAAILKAFTSRASFNGAITLLDRQTSQIVDDQRDGQGAVVGPGADVEVFASGIRNAYDVIAHSNGYVYATDNGPNAGFGAASTGLTTQGGVPHPDHPDELLHIERGHYYGHPNRARGIDDPRELHYFDELAPSIPHEFTQRIAHLASSTNGLEEYRAAAFGGQLRGALAAVQLFVGTRFFPLAPDGRTVADPLGIAGPSGNSGLDIAVAPGGAIATCDYYGGKVRLQVPDDVAAVGLSPYDVFPGRGPNVAGVPFELGGQGFGPAATTSVLFNGVPAVVTSVTAKRIRGVVPVQPGGFAGPVDVVVQSASQRVTLTGAYRYLPPQRGLVGGFWRQSDALPAALGDATAAELSGKLYVFGQGDSRTFVYDALQRAWQTSLAPRPYSGGGQVAEAAHGRVHVLGGTGAVGRVQIFDPATGSWSLGAPMPWAGQAVATAVIGGRIFVAGGLVGGNAVANAAVYDPATNAWTSLGSLPIGVHHASGGTDGTRFFVLGGRLGGGGPQAGLQLVQVFDPQSSTWVTSQGGAVPALPLARSGAGRAVSYRGELLLFGGEGVTSTFSEVLAYDPVAGSWRFETPLPSARHGHGVVRLEDRVFLLGGNAVPGPGGSTTAEVFQRR